MAWRTRKAAAAPVSAITRIDLDFNNNKIDFVETDTDGNPTTLTATSARSGWRRF